MLLIPAGNPSAWTGPEGNNTYLLTGEVPTLIDAGVGEPSHLAAVERALGGVPLAQIVITHGHPDHVKGLPLLLSRWPDARVRAAPPGPPSVRPTSPPGPTPVEAGSLDPARSEGSLDPARPAGSSDPDSPECRDGEIIRAGDTTLRALHTPGHAPDHFCFMDEETRDVYCGDMARLGGSIVIPASKGGSLQDYLESLRRIRALEPRRLLPGHGPIVEDPARLIDDYLRHRQQREEQVLDVLRSGTLVVEEIVRRIYPRLDSALVRAAGESVLAHLVKLRDEGRAAETPDGWRVS